MFLLLCIDCKKISHYNVVLVWVSFLHEKHKVSTVAECDEKCTEKRITFKVFYWSTLTSLHTLFTWKNIVCLNIFHDRNDIRCLDVGHWI